jgi:hypothetical protein
MTHTRAAGRGRLEMFVACSETEAQDLILALHEAGFDVVAYVRRGRGGTFDGIDLALITKRQQ